MHLTRISGNIKYFTHQQTFNTLFNTCIKIMFMKGTMHSLAKVMIPNSVSASLLTILFSFDETYHYYR